MTANWQIDKPSSEVHPAATYNANRRTRLGAQFPNTTLVIPTGNLKVRANDTDYRFRAGTDFYYLTGCHEPDCVLVQTTDANGLRSTLYVPDRRDHHTHEFFTDARYGELWVGARRGVSESAEYYAIASAPLEQLAKDLATLDPNSVRTVRGFDQSVDAMIAPHEHDNHLSEALSEARLVKDDFEIAQLQLAIDATIKGFEDVVRVLPAAQDRSERVIEGIFNLRARVEGNDVGYDTIAATGSNATVLHWTHNNGTVRRGDMLLLDAGVECENLYTADVTRTLPISGVFSPAQRRIYNLVLAAQKAALAAVKPGVAFNVPHDAAMRVLAQGLIDLGILSGDLDTTMRRDRQLHRRYTLHGTSHMLGLDVHDCAQARDDVYRGELHEGYVLTVEPGLYFQPNDLTVPEEYRGIGVRIEDDVLVTAEGALNLSRALPREPDEVEAWMRAIWSAGTTDLHL